MPIDDYLGGGGAYFYSLQLVTTGRLVSQCVIVPKQTPAREEISSQQCHMHTADAQQAK